MSGPLIPAYSYPKNLSTPEFSPSADTEHSRLVATTKAPFRKRAIEWRLGRRFFLLSICGPGVECPRTKKDRTFRRKALRPLRSSRNRLRQQEARRKLVSSVRHQCREARPMACRSAGPTRSLSMARRAIKARWRSIIHHSTLLSFGIVGDPAGSRTVCPVSHIMRNGTAISIYASFKTLSTGRKFARSFSFNAARRC